MISLHQVSKSFGPVAALSDINLEVMPGELFGLIGPDGAGKSTLFRILASLLLPDKGTAKVFGCDVNKDYRQIRSFTGYMPGRFSLYTDLSVAENLEFFATVYGTSVKKNFDLIKEVYEQIEPFRDRLAGKLSGGMKQKLALSCALIHRPKLLILDEPTTGVDAVSRKEFWDLLKSLIKNDITIIVSTPYMVEAELCSRIALIQAGRLMAINTPDGIKTAYPRIIFSVQSNQPYQLLADLRRFNSQAAAIPFGSDVHYTPNADGFDKAELESFLKEQGHENIVIQPAQVQIEDIFIDLMSQQKIVSA
ncbi:MAG: ABC transporter ATP-binding protein [Bacteroidota bacterium]|nr:MAG: ABC transporter ATP-binding protein [Bacteroidota bacterium]